MEREQAALWLVSVVEGVFEVLKVKIGQKVISVKFNRLYIDRIKNLKQSNSVFCLFVLQ